MAKNKCEWAGYAPTGTAPGNKVAAAIRETVAGWTTAYDQGKVSSMIDLHDVAEVLMVIARKLDNDE
jgi:hypothetical protein